jgi:hypothetical protein
MRAHMLAAGAVWLASAAAAAEPTFPPSLQREPLMAWLQRETDIRPDSVVAVTPQVITAIVSSFPAGGGQGPRVVIRAEALSPDTFARTGALSWHVSLSADCLSRLVKLGETTGYPERNLLGERRALRPEEADWRKPTPGTALDNAWRAACDKDFRGPLQSPELQMTRPDPQSPLARRTPPGKAQAAQTAPPPAPSASAGRVMSAVATAPVTRPMSRLAVQVAAVSSEAEARAVLASLGRQVGSRKTWIETGTVGGRVWRRALVGGFANAAEATQFCAQLKSAGRNCFVRTAAPPRVGLWQSVKRETASG